MTEMEVESPLDKICTNSQELSQMKSKKKRKRDKEKNGDFTDDQPTAIHKPDEKSPLNVQIQVVYDQTDKTPPIVGYFPSGYKPLKHNESSNIEETSNGEHLRPNVKFYRNAQRNKIEKSSNGRNEKWRSTERMEVVVSPDGTNVDFVGKSYKSEAAAAQLCTYALGVLDKKTQTLKIMPIAGNKIFRLEPKVQGLDVPDKEPLVMENEELSRADMLKSLTTAYGSKRSIMQGKKIEALSRGDNPESQMDLDKRIDNVVANKDALTSISADVARNVPPHNTSATTPQEAYPLSRIILSGEWDYLEDIYETMQVEEGVLSNAYPTFVRNRIHKLREIQDEVQRQTHSRIFSYITHLLKFKDLHSLDGASSAKNHRFPSILRRKFTEMFTPDSRKLPIEKIHLLISYVLVLTLYCDDFRTDPTDIAKDLRVSQYMLRDHFQNLGCKIVRENKLSLATLPVPLKFPSQSQRRKR